MRAHHPPSWVPAVAQRQSGLFTAAQVIEAGATRSELRHRLASGRWVRTVGDALASAELPLNPWVRAQAAGLTWPDAVVCLSSAATLHGLPVAEEAVVHLIVPNRRPSRRSLVSHELRIDPSEVCRRGSALVTTPERTLFDCLGRLPREASESLAAWAASRGRLAPGDLGALVDARRGWWGNVNRRRAVDAASTGALSAAERRLHQILRRAGITGWSANARLYAGSDLIGRADVLFAAVWLVLEVDGYVYHGRDRFQADRSRQNALVAAGYTVLRFTWTDLTERPDDVVARVRSTLRRLELQPSAHR